MDRRHFLHYSGAALLATLQPLAARAQTPVEALPSGVTAIADQAIRDQITPGIQIAVWKNGAPLVSLARGWSHLETTTPVSADSVFRAGSLTKQFTAALIAKLQDEGRLSVHDRLEQHLSFFKGMNSPTLLELIHQTAGLHDSEDSTPVAAPLTQLQLAEQIARQQTLYDFTPGSAWRYSNANYLVLGAVIEAVTGQPLAVAATERVFAPLGLGLTRFDARSEIVKDRAAGYSSSGEQGAAFINAEPIAIEQTGGAGGIRSTATELCRWHHALFFGSWLSAGARQALVEPALLRDGRPITQGRFDPQDHNMGETSYGYGLLLDRSTRSGGVIAMHNGFVSGFSAYLATYLPAQLTVACLCNVDPRPDLPFRALRKAVFAPYL